MTAQFLYDLRALTGFVSGQELAEIFRQMFNDPAPSGMRNTTWAEAKLISPEFAAELDGTVGEFWEHVRKYTGAAPENLPTYNGEILKERLGDVSPASMLSQTVRLIITIEQKADR